MCHVLGIGERPCSGIESRGSQLAVKRIVLQRAAHDEWPPVRQHDHAVTEHVPGHRLSADGVGLRIPDSRLVVCVAGDVSRAGDHQYLARVQQRDVHGIDRHGIGQGCPLPLYVWLSHGRGGQKKKCYKSEGEDSPRAHSKSVFHETPRVTEVVLWQLGTNNQGEVYAKLEVATRRVEYFLKYGETLEGSWRAVKMQRVGRRSHRNATCAGG